MTGREDRDFDSIIGGFNLNDEEEQPEKENPKEVPPGAAKAVFIQMALSMLATILWGMVVGLGTMFLFETFYESGATSLPQPGFIQSVAIGVSAILIVAGLRHGSR